VARHRDDDDEGSGVSWLLRWVVVPLLIALPAPVATVVAAAMAQEPPPHQEQSCIELYQAALNIEKSSPNFRIPSNSPDQVRCNINSVLDSQPRGH